MWQYANMLMWQCANVLQKLGLNACLNFGFSKGKTDKTSTRAFAQIETLVENSPTHCHSVLLVTYYLLLQKHSLSSTSAAAATAEATAATNAASATETTAANTAAATAEAAS